MEKILDGKRLTAGVCYYPEHWEEKGWADDLRRMKENGIEVVRIAEFAWNKIEAEEGVFQYDFFDRFLETAKQADMKVIFCTPTATPPAWVTTKYPETLNADIRGVLYRHGSRRHYNYNSPKYRELCARIVEKSAAHYGKHPNIIGWQIDNELNCELEFFYSESDRQAFRVWVKEKYGTLDCLNKAWGTVFWNQTYTDWEEVDIPAPTCHDTVNPHRMLDYIRFISDSACSFAKMQSDILRKYCKPDDFITTNGIFPNLDYRKLVDESLDFITYDSYPNFAYCVEEDPLHSKDLNDRKWSRNLAEIRAISERFGIMEQQTGANGWNTRMEAPTPRPGQIKLWTMQSIAHGADFISYFRWRTCTVGTEMYWHGILDYSGRENRRLREVGRTTACMAGLAELAGSVYEARLGILKDYDNLWDAGLDRWHGRLEEVSQPGIFRAAQLTHTPFDYVYVNDSLTQEKLAGYQVLIYPHACMMDEKKAGILEKYVRNGGILVFGCRSGYKDMQGHCVQSMLPGLLADLSGTDIPEYSMVAPDVKTVKVNWQGRIFEAAVFTELLAPGKEEAQTEGVYESDYFAGEGAVIAHPYGKGKVYYYGSTFTQEAAEVFLEKTGVIRPYRDYAELPACCELAVRKKENVRYLFVLNYEKNPVSVYLKKGMTDLEDGKLYHGLVELEGYGVKVYRMEDGIQE